MAMPRQLAQAKRPKRSEPRPLVEQLKRIDVDDLCRWNVFPDQRDWHKTYYFEAPFRIGFVQHLKISLACIEVAHHTGYNQTIRLRWCRTGFGGNFRPRPLSFCNNCGRAVRRLYFKHSNLNCRRCANAIYASQICSGPETRAQLQATRLRTFLQHKSGMSRRNRQRLQARIPRLTKPQHLSKRISDRVKLPQTNHGTYGPLPWQ